MTETERLVREFKRRGGKVKRIRTGLGGLVVKTRGFFFARRQQEDREIRHQQMSASSRGGGNSSGLHDFSGHRAVAVDTAMAEGRFT